MLKCPFCDSAVPTAAAFCPNCGAALAQDHVQLPEDSTNLEDQIRSLLSAGRKIEAIKLYREQTGAGLKAAKDAVEALAARRGIVAPRGAGCLALMLLLLTAMVAVGLGIS